MAFENDIGFRKVRVLDSEPATKNYVRVRQVDALDNKNYVNVKEVPLQPTKNWINVFVVEDEFPKNYLNVNFLPVTTYGFDGVDDYIEIPEWVAEGDFEIEMTIVAETDNTSMMTCGWSATTETWGFFFQHEAGRWYARLANRDGSENYYIIADQGSLPPVGVPMRLKAVRTVDTVEFFIDGVSEGVDTNANVGSVGIDRIGCRGNNTLFWQGNIRNVSLKDLDNPSNSRFYPINDGWANNPVIRDTLNTSTELVVSTDIVGAEHTGGGTGGINGNIYTVSNPLPSTIYPRLRVQLSESVEVDTDYLIKGEILVSGGLEAGVVTLGNFVGGGENVVIPNLGGKFGGVIRRDTLGPLDDIAYITLSGINSLSGDTATVVSLSVTKLGTNGEAINFEEANWGES